MAEASSDLLTRPPSGWRVTNKGLDLGPVQRKIGVGCDVSPVHIGLVVPSTNTVFEADAWALVPEDIRIQTARISISNMAIERRRLRSPGEGHTASWTPL